MAIKIEQPIVGYEVAMPDEDESSKVTQIAPLLERDDVLVGNTYKIKTPLSEHALYITINDVITTEPDGKEHHRPFEIFINSKNMENFSWIVALTRVISAVFRKGGDVTFLAEELKAVFDPRGGYFKKGGKYMPSLVAEIGEVIEQHMISIGMIEGDLGSAELELKKHQVKERLGDEALQSAALCPKCSAKALVRLDNCDTCLECGHSKCG